MKRKVDNLAAAGEYLESKKIEMRLSELEAAWRHK